jgi:Zn-dependent M16 (insulinase) family peptidase
MPASSFAHPAHAHEVVVGQMLKTDFLWERVRMRGGAYGVTASVNGGEMLFNFSSYRDPKIKETIDSYRAGLDWLIKNEVSSEELEKAIIGIVGRDLRPLSPGEKGLIGFRRCLYEISDELRQRKRDELLRCTPDQIQEAAARLRENLDFASTVVMAGENAIAEITDDYSALRKNTLPIV